MSVTATGGRFAASLLDTSTDTRAEAVAPRPSDTVYANATVPTAPGAGITCTAPWSAVTDTRVPSGTPVISVTIRASPSGSSSLATTSTTTGWSTLVRAMSSRATGGSLTPSSSISWSRISPMSGFSSVSVSSSSPDCSSSGSSPSVPRALPQSSIRSNSMSVPAIHIVPLVKSLIHTHPLTSRRRSAAGSAPVSAAVWSATP